MRQRSRNLTFYYAGIAVIWGAFAILIVPLSDLGGSVLPLPGLVGTMVAGLVVLGIALLAHRAWHRRWTDRLPQPVGPQHGSLP